MAVKSTLLTIKHAYLKSKIERYFMPKRWIDQEPIGGRPDLKVPSIETERISQEALDKLKEELKNTRSIVGKGIRVRAGVRIKMSSPLPRLTPRQR